MKTYLCIITALIFIQLFHLSSNQFDNPTADEPFGSILDLSRRVDNTTILIADVKSKSEISSDDSLQQTFPTTPQNKTFIDFSKRNSTLKVSILPGDLSNSTIYHCGYTDARDIYEHIYPEYRERIRKANPLNRRTIKGSTENDVLLVGFGGYCGAPPKLKTGYFEKYFKGTVIQINRENFTDEMAWQDPKNSSTIPKNQYHLGYVESGCQSLRIFYMAQFLLLQKELWDFFFQIEKKPVSSRERFLIYTAGNCVDFRESAFDAISLANPSLTVEYAAGCHGNMNLPNIAKYEKNTGRDFRKNWKFMGEFRFCLVMENSYVEGYITEKILLAFTGGCIPIYYGSVEIFDIFNPKSFIYYDIENPKDALNEIARLENNATAYDEVMAEPILLEGNKTIQKYFSLSDEIIPNAMLKKKIREMVYFRCR